MQTILFDNQGTFTTPTFTQSGVTISGSNSLQFLNLNGLGVTGGLDNTVVDRGEFLTFQFEGGAASNVSYGLQFAGNGNGDNTLGERKVEAFDINGNSLGSVTTSGLDGNVSASFGDRLISGFRIQSIPGDNFRLNSVTFTREFIVDTLIDENDGDLRAGDVSLREAILGTPDGGTIRFAQSLTGGAIPLTLGELAINKNLAINGLGANNLTISGSKESRIFRIGGNTQVDINGLTLADGFSQEDGGAIDNRGILNLSNSIVRDSIASDDGGGIHNVGTLRLINSTISNNIAEDDGGGIGNFGGRVEANNSTFSNNAAQSDGGGIFNFNGRVQLVSNTLTNNAVDRGNGGGIRSFQGTTSVNNTIVAENFDSGEESPDVDGRFTSNGFNLIGISNGSTGFNNGINGDIVGTSTTPINPHLTPLQNNGGSTFTHALLLDSPALNNGNPNITGSDQRGINRPQGTGVDIGAVELPYFDSLRVDTLNDELDGDLSPGDVSLREAIFFTNSGGIVDFDSSLTGGTISVTLGELKVNKNLSIQGMGANNLTIKGSIDTEFVNPFRIFNINDGNDANQITVQIQGLTITAGNVAFPESGGGIANRENLSLISSTVDNNAGGGIFNAGNLTVLDSTISNNVGEGIENRGNLNLLNSTISGNQANVNIGGDGGGILNANPIGLEINSDRANATIINSTITNNITSSSGGGIANLSGATIALSNTIVAGNTSATRVSSDIHGVFTSNGFNLIGNGDGGSGFSNGVNGDIVGTFTNPIAPRLSPLQDNGGFTFTHVPLPDSPAIDNGNPNAANTLDQRRISRPQGLGVDIGAVEFRPENLTVTTLNDEFDGDLTPGDVSLREAIFFTNAGGTINFDDNLAGGAIALTSGELAIAKNLTIQGLGANNLTISGNNVSRVFNIDDGDLNTSINVTIDGLTITNGTTTGDGGAIFNSENLTVNNSTITTNTANFGGGIFNIGNATVSNSTIDSNTANSHGGGILNRGNLTVDRSTIFANLALSEGGGINNDGGTLTVTNSTINSNVGQTYSGGIDNDRGTATIINSTISDNFAENFGGIAAYLANTTVINSTITANVGNGDGNGLFNGTGSTATVTNSIVAGNWNNNDIGAIAPFTSGGNNLIGNSNGVAGFTNGLNGDIVGTAANPIDPLIGTLQDNGGATFTHALLPGSLAIDAGNNNNAPTTDQRGIIRPQDAVDIGAFELVGNPITSFDPVLNGSSVQSGFSTVSFSTLRDELLPTPNEIAKLMSDNLSGSLMAGNTTELLFA